MKNFESTKNSLDSGSLVRVFEKLFASSNANIPSEYIYLIADYCKKMNDRKDVFSVDPSSLFATLTEKLKGVEETDLGGIYGYTKGDKILMEKNLDYQTKKKYFFHELSHMLQTRTKNGVEECSFDNGKNGMFFAEGSAQIVGEMIWAMSNDEALPVRIQNGKVPGNADRSVYAATSLYQYNENIMRMAAISSGTTFKKLLSWSFDPEGREKLRSAYEGSRNDGSLNKLFSQLEKIYEINAIGWTGHKKEMENNTPQLINGREGQYYGNYQMQGQLMDQIERSILANYVENNSNDYILDHYQDIHKTITTPRLKSEFDKIMAQVANMYLEEQSSTAQQK